MLILSEFCDDAGIAISIAKWVVQLIQFTIPIILIVWGIIDVAKAIAAGKEDDIKKWQKTLVQRVIAAVAIFLIPFLVSIIMGLIGSTEWKECWNNADPKINFKGDI